MESESKEEGRKATQGVIEDESETATTSTSLDDEGGTEESITTTIATEVTIDDISSAVGSSVNGVYEKILGVPKSRIPVPASVYMHGARSGYLANLGDHIYRKEWVDEDDFEEEKKPTRGYRKMGGKEDDYGPPGILHEKKRRGRMKRRSSSEFGDSSIELLGPSETLDTDESDGSAELLSDLEEKKKTREEDKTKRAGSAADFFRVPEKKGVKTKSMIIKSKTVGDKADEGSATEEREKPPPPPVVEAVERKRPQKVEDKKEKVQIQRVKPSSFKRTSRRRKEEKSPVVDENAVGDGEPVKREEPPISRRNSRRRNEDRPFSSRRDSKRRKEEKEKRKAEQSEKWKRVDAVKRPKSNIGLALEWVEEDHTPKKAPRQKAKERMQKRVHMMQGIGTKVEPKKEVDTEKWRIQPAVREKKPEGDKDGEEGQSGSEMDSEEESDSESSSSDEGEEGEGGGKKHKAPKVKKVDPNAVDDPMQDERQKEEAVRDTAAGIRLLQLCQTGEWQGVDGHIRYFEKRVVAGLIQNPTPLLGLKDESSGWTPLMYAIKDNKIRAAEKLIELGCDVNAKTRDGIYPIHIAAMYGKEDMIRFLIFKEADLTVVTEKGKQNALHIVCARKSGNTSSMVRSLVGAMPASAKLQEDADGNIPLILALNIASRGACQELLIAGAEEQLNVEVGEMRDTPLHLATRKRDLELIRVLTDSGANVDARNRYGSTPLHIASEIGDENLAKFFYLCKANPHLMDGEDRTPIFLAAMNGHTLLVDLLADKFKVSVFERARDGSTLMHIASLHGHPETAMALFRKGVPLQMPNKGGARSIHIAARNGHAGMIAKLLEKGEKVDACTNDNFTALHIAVEAVKPLVVETLLGYGAQVHIKGGKDKETPLHIAARVTGGEKCALMLLKSGADPNITMENGEAPLHVAARCGRIKIVQLLLREGADPQQKAKEGDTPLHFACRFGHLKVVEALLEHVKRKSANECTLFINMVTIKGESSLHYAARLNASRVRATEEDLDGVPKADVGRLIVKQLLEGNASTSRQTKDANETAFHYCCREGNNDILIEMLSRLSSVECMRALNRQSSKGWSPLLIASRRGHTEVVKTLLKYHARVDVFDNDGRSGLHLAAENGYQEICGILLEHRAFINAKSRVGLTALHLAAMKGFTRLCLFLIQQHGAAVDALTLKKQTPLHLAAESGQLEVCRLLMGLRASPDATDDKGQKPIHLAAQNNHADVIKLFLKHSPQLCNSFTKDGSTCAHLAAMQGSVAVLEELMKFDKQGVINARNRSTDATALQLAAEGGHADLVKTLLKAGASASDENRLGYTAAHLAAKNGHMNVLEALRNAQEDSINITSRKLGMSALHIAAFYGQTETVRDLLQFIPATSGTDPPMNVGTSFIKDLGTESGLTPLHMAAYSGEENVVRLLLNFEGVQVDAPTASFGFNPLHLACKGGHTTVVGLLLSRSAELLESKDGSGKASLHIAAVNGHKQMVEVLLGQGAEIDAIDKELWTPLICAAKAGHLDVVKLLVESGASPLAKTQKGQSPIWFAAAENHVDVLSYLMKKDHDTYGLMEDKDFVYNLCVCGKNIDNEPIDEFVLSSPAPVDVAAKMSHFLVYVSTKEKERAKDLIAASEHCSAMATELLALAAGAESAAKVLSSVDRKGMEFLDVLIECEQKEVIAHTVVQRHLQEIWVGQLVEWADWKLLLVFFSCVFIPPVWVTISMPFGPEYNKIPIVKFMSYLTSHIHLMTLLSLTAATPIVPILPIRTNLNPFWFEWILFAWLGGLLIAEITNPSDKSGLGFVKILVLVFSYMGIILHGAALFMDKESMGTVLYLRDQLFGLAILSACVQILDFLSFHYLFGPWAIIIGNLMKDLARFLAVLCIFMIGFSLMMTALNHPLHERRDLLPGEKPLTTLTGGMASGVLVTPVDAFEMLFFALFGLNGVDDLKIETLGQPGWTIVLFKIFFGVYLLVTVIVLINLLIAMMSDTYQRIEQQSDIEWKFGLAKLIRNMHRTTATPSPLNLFVDWGTWIHRKIKKARQPKNKLQWGEQPEGVDEEEKKAEEEKNKDVKVGAKQRWHVAFQKASPDSEQPQQRLSIAQISPIAAMGGAGGAGGEQGLSIGSTLSTGATNRIETVTDWKIISKKYYTLVGKEEPQEEKPEQDKLGSRQGSGSTMGSSMMLMSQQKL